MQAYSRARPNLAGRVGSGDFESLLTRATPSDPIGPDPTRDILKPPDLTLTRPAGRVMTREGLNEMWPLTLFVVPSVIPGILVATFGPSHSHSVLTVRVYVARPVITAACVPIQDKHPRSLGLQHHIICDTLVNITGISHVWICMP